MRSITLATAFALAFSPISASAQSGQSTGDDAVAAVPAPSGGGVAQAPTVIGTTLGIEGAGIVALSGLVILTGTIIGLAVSEEADTATTTTTTTN